MRSTIVSIGLVLGFAVATSAGAAENLSGTYSGTLRCKGLANGAAEKTKQDVVIDVAEDVVGFNLQIHAGATQIGEFVRGFVMDDAAKPDRAKFFGVDCDVDLVSLSNLTLIGDAVAKAGSDKATLKGSLTDTTGKTRVLDCTFSAKRTSTTPAKFPGCLIE
jgi:hypothetical protein